ncbi:MAG: DNA polymerase/3'-5' exonuclease PolX [Candidatus Woesearchaeota archaeon]
MKNQEIARIFYEIADILELKGVQWKPQAYRKAARSLENLGKDIEQVYKKQGLKGVEEIPGIGENLALKIEEYIKTGKIKSYQKYRKSIPKGISDLMKIPGLGPKRAKKLYKELNIRSIKDLEAAAKKHRIINLSTFKEKSEQNIEKGIELMKKRKRMLLGTTLPIAEDIVKKLKTLREVKEISIAGSLRRMNSTIGDIDILITSSNPIKVMDFFTSLPKVTRILAKGPTKSSALLGSMQVDLRIVEEKSYGSALQYFTGNKDHNIRLREIARKKGLKLSEYGLFKQKQIAGRREKDVYKKLGMQYIEPELRENTGEIAAAINGKLPKLIKLTDIKGDLHMHTTWSDGRNSIKEMVLAAKAMGYEYIAITDHSRSDRIGNGITEDTLLEQVKAIRRLNIKGIKVLAGAEVDILVDGSLDFDDSVLKKLDLIVASIHHDFKMPKAKMTSRVIRAMENRNVKIIGHPTKSPFGDEVVYNLDFPKILEAARETGTALEINAQTKKMDLNFSKAREAKDQGVKLVINTDSHSCLNLANMRLGVAIARKAWCEKAHILNTLKYSKLVQALKK